MNSNPQTDNGKYDLFIRRAVNDVARLQSELPALLGVEGEMSFEAQLQHELQNCKTD